MPIRLQVCIVCIASFPGLSQLQFFGILQAIKNWSRERPGNEAIVCVGVHHSNYMKRDIDVAKGGRWGKAWEQMMPNCN